MSSAHSTVSPNSLKNRFLASYGVALFLLVAVSLVAHIFIERTLVQEREAANMVNLSGAQRMLSQRTLALAQSLSLPEGRQAAREERLVVTLNRFQASHTELRTYALTHPMAPSLQTAFEARFTGTNGLDQLVSDFVVLAEPALDRALTVDELSRLEALAYGPVFEGLDEAVSLFQADAENGLAAIAAAHMIQLIVIILVLVGEALFIFWPLTRKLVTAMVTEIRARKQAEEALRLEASMSASKQRFVSMIQTDYLEPLDRVSNNLLDMEASDRASWPGLIAMTKREVDTTRQRVGSMVDFFDQWQSSYGDGEDEDAYDDRVEADYGSKREFH